MPPLSLKRLQELQSKPRTPKSLRPQKSPRVSSNWAEKKSSKSFEARGTPRGIIYLSHLPHGFYEQELRNFLGQFGCITNLRVGRSKHTGNSKGYAFVEFAHPEVAAIVAETMNNYLMFDRLVKCRLLDKDEIRVSRTALFANKREPGKKFFHKNPKRTSSSGKSERHRKGRLVSKLKGIKTELADLVDVDISALAKKSRTEDERGGDNNKNLENKGKNNKKMLKRDKESSKVEMVVDTEEEEVTLRTPPNVRKVARTKRGKKVNSK